VDLRLLFLAQVCHGTSFRAFGMKSCIGWCCDAHGEGRFLGFVFCIFLGDKAFMCSSIFKFVKSLLCMIRSLRVIYNKVSINQIRYHVCKRSLN
jgi:hypothetical protein